MSNLNLSGKDILKFLLAHYEFVQLAFNASKPDFIIDADKFLNLINEYNTSSESKISVSKITVDLKFCRQIPTGEYKLNGNYTSFLEFIFDDFILDLPETLKNRYQAIFSHFTSLQVEANVGKIILLIQEIIKVVEKFLNDIEGQTYRLLRDTESLKINAENHSDFTMRIQKANYWIDEYIIPLNSILNIDHPHSVVNAIVQIQRYTSEKRILTENYELKREFEKLYGCTVSAKVELDQTLSRLTRELLPLLERIKSDSIILSGFYHYVENVDQPENYIISLPALLRKTKTNVISKTFGSEAAFFIDQFSYYAPEVLYKEQYEELEWLPDASYFKDQILKAKGVDDFYQWCFDALKEHTNNITLSKYFTVSNLILEEDLLAEYAEGPRFEIQLSDAILQMPKVKLYEKLPQ
ncbi:hypothetical protein ACFOWA_20280 [Pedobacter lithocola]|uniref:Uncharacterized protein n=1 Tax=Pedobacter lithocola TaxID=1908239 RepID=A0ABV8PH13_9SPHI